MALGYLFGAEAFDDGDALDERAGAFLGRLDPREVAIVRTQVARRLNAPLATSAGRLFDAAASLLGLRDVAEFEAQAAIDLEMAAVRTETSPLRYRLVREGGLLVFDPRPTLADILDGTASGIAAGRLAARFQATIAEVTRELCAAARRASGLRTVCLSGGVFQNRWLTDRLLDRLASDGFEVHINERVPVNDGGICFGQAAVAAARMAGKSSALLTAGATAGPPRG
jgi:hydrogenase maturation protein HypF